MTRMETVNRAHQTPELIDLFQNLMMDATAVASAATVTELL